MSDTSAFGFGKFIPGFDFLQNLSKAGQGAAALPSISHWVAPTVSVEEIDKRIEELKAVQFWLEQNSRALSATVQALQVQKMTLSTLQGMNVNMADLAKAFPFAAATAPAAASTDASDGGLSDWPLGGREASAQASAPAAAPKTQEAAPPVQESDAQNAAADSGADSTSAAQTAAMQTAMQWWSSLTQQFQQIAQQALQNPAQQEVIAKATQMTSDFAKVAVQTAGDMVRQAVVKGGGAPVDNPAPETGKSTTTKAPKKVPAKKAAAADKKGQHPAAAAKPVAAKKTIKTAAARKPATR